MAKQKRITGSMDLAEAIAVSKTYPLEVLLANYHYACEDEDSEEARNRALLISRGALYALAECPDPQTMRRMAALLRRDDDYDSTWCAPIKQRLENKTISRTERAVVLEVLTPLVLRKSTDHDPDTLNAMSALAEIYPHPLPTEIVTRCRAKLASRNFAMASTALSVILNLPTTDRDPFIPALIKLMEGKFSGNSEASWIMSRLTDHLETHGKIITAAVRNALASHDKFAKLARDFFAALPVIGERGKVFIQDVLAYIGRESVITHYKPRLIHIDPNGGTAIPALIGLVHSDSLYVRISAIDELGAYGPLAGAAQSKLTAVAEAGKGNALAFDSTAAYRALAAIRQSIPRETDGMSAVSPHVSKTGGRR
ncbi:hypothetical protein [Gemmata sp.]|uniref:hypothetical protein n=1 Tax=Gemmata sp. TaxID=1914242 RepID=UPI003F70CE6E